MLPIDKELLVHQLIRLGYSEEYSRRVLDWCMEQSITTVYSAKGWFDRLYPLLRDAKLNT